jgi:hypothetical protein
MSRLVTPFLSVLFKHTAYLMPYRVGMSKIMQRVSANDLPTAGKKAEGWNHPLITGDWINRREQERSIKRFV